MNSKYDVSGKYRNSRAEGSQPRISAREPEALTPSAQRDWTPRRANDISVEDPVLRQHKTLFGTPYVDVGEFHGEIRQAARTNREVVALLKAKTEKEEAFQELERIQARRELLPGRIERERLEIGTGITLAQVEVAKARHLLAEQDRAALDHERLAELDQVEFELELARKRAALAEARERAANAEAVAKLKAQTEQADAERERNEATRRLRAHQSGAEGGLAKEPSEFTAALATQTRRGDIARAAAKRESAILARVDGDESQLTEEEIDELEGIRGAKERAQRAVDESSALGAIFPQESGDEA